MEGRQRKRQTNGRPNAPTGDGRTAAEDPARDPDSPPASQFCWSRNAGCLAQRSDPITHSDPSRPEGPAGA